MDTLKFSYPAIKILQNDKCSAIILFGASAWDISNWVGIPQKTKFGEVESVGFQRTDNEGRLKELKKFYSNEENVVQNTLICSIRDIKGCSVSFSGDETGRVNIELPNFKKMNIKDLFGILRSCLESRISDKSLLLVPESLKAKFRQELALSIPEDLDKDFDDNTSNIDISSDTENESSSLVLDESHLIDFIHEVSARHELLKELGDDYSDKDSFLGFTKDAIIAFILPVSLVDGQHRLKGAIEETQDNINSGKYGDETSELIISGKNADDVNEELLKNKSRTLPISLLMSSDPSEQVFQFVVINQKATPIERSLLGTIVSTTLTNEEMEKVSERLMNSGIKLEEARAITWMARNESSPFFKLVERGVGNEKNDLLQWSVMGSIINIFKELNGGVIFGERNDYAKIWKAKLLNTSLLVSNYDESIYETPFDYWRSLDGPWRDLFVVFWGLIKDKFAQTDNPERFNFWGKPRTSNIFNKISLTVLAADFFEYLVVTQRELNSLDEIKTYVDKWLTDVQPHYFDRDWQLSGVKKDSKGIRDRWAELWTAYRKNPEKLPPVPQYRNPKKS